MEKEYIGLLEITDIPPKQNINKIIIISIIIFLFILLMMILSINKYII